MRPLLLPPCKVYEPETDSFAFLHVECDKSFTRSDALAKHTRVQHPSLVPQSNASRSAGSSAAKTAFEAMLSIFPGGYPKGTGKRWEEEEEDWSRLDQSLGGKGKVPDRVEFTEDVVPSRTIAGKKKTKKSAGKKKKKRGDDSSSDLTEWEDDSVDELALLPPGGEEVVDPDGGGAGSDSDDSLSSYLLPPPLLVKAPGSKPPIVQKYILAKGLHRSSLATRAGLEADLKQLEVELKRVRESKDKALNDLLYREFGCVPFQPKPLWKILLTLPASPSQVRRGRLHSSAHPSTQALALPHRSLSRKIFQRRPVGVRGRRHDDPWRCGDGGRAGRVRIWRLHFVCTQLCFL